MIFLRLFVLICIDNHCNSISTLPFLATYYVVYIVQDVTSRLNVDSFLKCLS